MSIMRDRSVLEHIIRYCNQIEEAETLLGKDYEVFILIAHGRGLLYGDLSESGK